GTLTVAAPGLQAADLDPDHNVMTTGLFGSLSGSVTTAHGGTVTVSANGAFTYVPARDFIGPDNFTYTESDLNGFSNIATVSLTVNPRTIVAPNLTYRVVSNQALTTTSVNGMLAAFVDPNGRAPSVLHGAVNTAHGKLVSF